MPVRDYKCPECGHKDENVFETIHEKEPRNCSKCSTVMIRMACAPSFTIQGGTKKFHQGR